MNTTRRIDNSNNTYQIEHSKGTLGNHSVEVKQSDTKVSKLWEKISNFFRNIWEMLTLCWSPMKEEIDSSCDQPLSLRNRSISRRSSLSSLCAFTKSVLVGSTLPPRKPSNDLGRHTSIAIEMEEQTNLSSAQPIASEPANRRIKIFPTQYNNCVEAIKNIQKNIEANKLLSIKDPKLLEFLALIQSDSSVRVSGREQAPSNEVILFGLQHIDHLRSTITSLTYPQKEELELEKAQLNIRMYREIPAIEKKLGEERYQLQKEIKLLEETLTRNPRVQIINNTSLPQTTDQKVKQEAKQKILQKRERMKAIRDEKIALSKEKSNHMNRKSKIDEKISEISKNKNIKIFVDNLKRLINQIGIL